MRAMHAAMLAFLLVPMTIRAQEVVIDPSQIAASASNAAEQIDYMLDQLSELANLGDKLGDMKDYIDDVFGEDGIGGKAINVMQDLGTIDRLTESFNATMSSTGQYAARLKELGRFSLSDSNAMLSYLNTAKNQAEMAIVTARKILGTMGFTKKEKKDELEKMIVELEEKNRKLSVAMEIEVEATVMAEGLSQFLDEIDHDMSSDAYVNDTKEYGSLSGGAPGAFGVISVLLALLAAMATAWGMHKFASSAPGDTSSELVFMRIGEALIVGLFVISMLSTLFHINL